MTIAYTAIALSTLAILLVWRYYRRYRRTLRSIDNGIELLKARDSSSRLARGSDPHVNKVIETFNSMAEELKNSRLKLREQNNLIDLLLSVSPMGVVMLDFDERIVSMNPAAQQFLECDDSAIGHHVSELPSVIAQRLSTLDEKRTETFTTSNAHIYKCTRETFFDRGASRPFYLIESLTEEVMNAERKAYEKVIRMIAHEVNNSTATLTSILEMVDNDLQNMGESTDDMRRLLHVCNERNQEMTAFIRRLADVVKIPDPIMQPIEVNSLMESNRLLWESQCEANHIRFSAQLCQENPKVNADLALMNQVFTNIIKNSIESIELLRETKPDHDGLIQITTTNTGEIAITDNGAGITDEASQMLFTPFFSTKPTGNGLGLLFIREVLTRHRANFSLKTEGTATTFAITLQKA